MNEQIEEPILKYHICGCPYEGLCVGGGAHSCEVVLASRGSTEWGPGGNSRVGAPSRTLGNMPPTASDPMTPSSALRAGCQQGSGAVGEPQAPSLLAWGLASQRPVLQREADPCGG